MANKMKKNEKQWKTELKKLIKKKEKNSEITQVFDMYCTVSNEIISRITKDNYKEIISAVAQIVKDISNNEKDFTVGVGMPGSLHPDTGLVQVSNTKALENY